MDDLDISLDNTANYKVNNPRRPSKSVNTDDSITKEDEQVFNDVLTGGISLIDKIFKSRQPGNKSGFGPQMNRSTRPQLTIKDLMNNIINNNKSSQEKVIDLESIPFGNNLEIDKTNDVTYNDNCISGSYYDDLNISIIHQIILNKLNKKKFILPELEKSLNDLWNIIVSRPFDNMLKSKINNLEDTIDKINNNLEINDYNDKAMPYIDKYENCNSSDRMIIILDYLDIAKKYIKIDLTRKNSNYKSCEICNETLQYSIPDSNGVVSCLNCDAKSIPLCAEKSQAVQEPIKMKLHSKMNSSDIKSFKKAYQKYVNGHIEMNFPDILIVELDKYFIGFGLHSDAVVKMELIGPINGRRTRGDTSQNLITSRELMINALKNIGYNEYIPKNYYLCRYYWQWENPNLTVVYCRLMNDYEISQMAYITLKGNKKSTLGSEYRLFRQLWHIGYPCHPSEFKIVLTDEFIKTYEEIWEKICEAVGDKLGWKKFVKIETLYMMNYETLELPHRFN